MNAKELMIPVVINQLDKCSLCKRSIRREEFHITVNFRKDDGKFTLEYVAACRNCVEKNPLQVSLPGKGMPLPGYQPLEN